MAVLAPFALTILLAAVPEPLNDVTLRAHFGSLSSLTADVGQVKEGRFWARPMRSQIKLHWTPDRITWETLTPVRSLVTIQGAVVTIIDAQGASRTLGTADPRFRALIQLLEAFLSLDLPRIERDFSLEYSGRELVARPRPSAAVPFFTGLRFRFNDQLELSSLQMDSEGERTELVFSKVVLERAGGMAR